MTEAHRVMGCERCGKPAALVGDQYHDGMLCPWCRMEDAPLAYKMFLDEERAAETKALATARAALVEIRDLCADKKTFVMLGPRGFLLAVNICNRILDGDEP